MFTTKTKKRVVAVITSFAMMLSCFAIIGTSEADAAAKKSIYVISKVSEPEYGYNTKFTYNKNGLLSKEKSEDGPRYFKYNKSSKLVKKTWYKRSTTGAPWQTITFKYKKGKMTSLISKGGDTNTTYNYSFTYNKSGKLAKAKFDDSFYKYTTKYSYKNKKLISRKNSGESIEKISFNKKGDITKIGEENISYTYKGGKVTKIKRMCVWGSNGTFKIKYKKIKVSKKMLKKVKAQQKSIRQYYAGLGYCLGAVNNY